MGAKIQDAIHDWDYGNHVELRTRKGWKEAEEKEREKERKREM